ncbi:hypothetical protein [Helicobacter trogontum]|uniref:Uncharacterized protein n=1 Tax=Helicobacter trogontum TaxID=50960 RepID=A0A4U8S8T0_9HELI|nr:hypothetical protein [Helicobacter trogontum]TLD82350.1 hypothetical protein LS81_008135 [Helicobacter trogontum]
MGMFDWMSDVWDNIKSFFGFGDKAAKDMGKQDSYDRDSTSASAEQADRIHQSLVDLTNEAKNTACKLEDQIAHAIANNFRQLEDQIQKINNRKFGSISLNLPIRQIKYTNRVNVRHIKGVLMQDLMPKLSIGNKECLKILKLKAGKDKEAEMRNFINKSFKESLIRLRNDMDTKNKDCIDNVNDKLKTRLGVMKANAQKSLDVLEDLKSSDGKDIAQKEHKQLVVLQELFFVKYATLLNGKKLRGNNG